MSNSNWFDEVFGYAANVVAEIRERVVLEPWFGRRPGGAAAERQPDIYQSFYGTDHHEHPGSDVEPWDRVLHDKLYPDRALDKAFLTALDAAHGGDAPSHQPGREHGIVR